MRGSNGSSLAFGWVGTGVGIGFIDPLTATDEQIKLWIARENLVRFGTTFAPPEAKPSTVVRVASRAGKKLVDPKWFNVTKVCPHCGEEKNVGRDFGVVIRRGIEGPSGWCRTCRATTDYRSRPRKNKTRHS